MLIFSSNFDVKSIFFPNFGQGPFPKIAGKGPVGKFIRMIRVKGLISSYKFPNYILHVHALLFLQTYLYLNERCRPDLLLRLRTKMLIFLFLIQNICCGYSKEPSQ